jgi:hypothetical protein
MRRKVDRTPLGETPQDSDGIVEALQNEVGVTEVPRQRRRVVRRLFAYRFQVSKCSFRIA